jgi:hypothetical protein
LIQVVLGPVLAASAVLRVLNLNLGRLSLLMTKAANRTEELRARKEIQNLPESNEARLDEKEHVLKRMVVGRLWASCWGGCKT